MELPDLPESPSDDDLASTSANAASDKRSFYQQLQVVTTFVTLIVAVTAIALSVWEGYETRLSNRLAVQPYLEGAAELRTNDSTYTYEVYIDSDGLGPAVYKKAMIYDLEADSTTGPVATTTEDRPILSLRDIPGIRDRWAKTNLPRSGFFGYIRQGMMQRPGDRRPFFSYQLGVSEVDTDPSERAPHFRAQDLLRTYSIVICYCSVYDDSCGQTHILGAPASDEVCADLGYEK